jgi:predicted amidohydrolase YtcJ
MAEKLIYNARVLRVSSDLPADAVAFQGDRITFVGSGAEGLSRDIPPENRIDLGGRTLIPGFNDNHLHLHSMADFFSRPRLKGMSCSEIVEYLRDFYPDLKPGETISGMGWDYPFCPEPHKNLLDRAFPDNPVVLFQFSGHGAWVNSPVLKKLGIDSSSRNPAGGQIVRDSSGDATGLLTDSAVNVLHEARLKEIHSRRELRRGHFFTAQELLLAEGITSVQDNTWYPASAREYLALRPWEELKLRISCWRFGMKPLRSLGMKLVRFSGDWVHAGPVKYFLDGTFSTRSAWLKESYPGDPQNFGSTALNAEGIERVIRRRAREGVQAAFHAIGDRTVHELAAAVGRVRTVYPRLGGLRFRAEHAQLIDPADMEALREAGMVIAAQPHAMGSPEKDTAILGEERARRSYPYRSLLDAGVPLSFGSDTPAESSYAPLYGIHLAVNRDSSEAITPLEALRAYTLGSAYAEFKENEKGSIDAGKLADFAVLSDDPTAVDPALIRNIVVEETVTGGRTVFSRDEKKGRP